MNATQSPARRRAALLLATGLAVAAPATGSRAEDVGRELFNHAWSPGDPRSRGGDGLGPVFNARSCVECHHQGGVGGGAATDRNIEIVTASSGDRDAPFTPAFGYAFSMSMGGGSFEYRLGTTPPPRQPQARGRDANQPGPLDLAELAAIHPGFRSSRSVVLHRFGTDLKYRAYREGVVGRHGRLALTSAQRNPTPLFGIGLLDAIPDEAIEAAARRRHPGWPTVRGRVARLDDGRVGRFGWKAQTASLDEFVRSAAATEMGLEVPDHRQAADPRPEAAGDPGSPGLDLSEEDCEALARFVRELPRPVVREPADAREAREIRAGRTAFKAVGCAECHTPDLGPVEGIYSDLLLHDMSPRLGDSGPSAVFVGGAGEPPPARAPRGEGGASAGEWRTPPLWGLRDSGPFMHDGRAQSIDEAVRLHGGEAEPSARRYAQLSAAQRRQVERFLATLAAPPRPEDDR